jgi:predicted DNA-binding WGR domain protein
MWSADRIDPARNMARRYGIWVQRDLWGQWATWVMWGRIGRRPRIRVIPAVTRQAAEAAAWRLLERKTRRGYRPGNTAAFTGEPNPNGESHSIESRARTPQRDKDAVEG